MKKLTVILTYDCNLSCTFCSQKTIQKVQMTPDNLLQSIDQILNKEDVEQVVITGGECLLYPELLEATAEKGIKRDIPVSLNTNLSLWSSKYTEWANANSINILGSVTGISNSEKPLVFLDIPSVRKINNLHLDYVLNPMDQFFDLFWVTHNLLNCGITISLNTHKIKDFNLPEILSIKQQCDLLKPFMDVKIHGIFNEYCGCEDSIVILPNGAISTHKELDNVPNCDSGCGKIKRQIPELYPLLQKVFL